MAFDINKVIKLAESEVGSLEKKSNSKLYDKTANAGSGNYTKYAYEMDKKYPNFYNGKKNGFAWCDVFVDWLFVTAYGEANAKKLLCQPSKSSGAGCKYSMNYYKAKNQFYSKNPKVGDQIFFYNSSKSGIAHTGLVYKVDNTYVYTIEGNTSSASGVVANGGAVAKKKYKLTYSLIAGYGRPAYGDQSYFKKTNSSTSTSVKSTFNVGDVVQFNGTTHYANAKALIGKKCKGGKAKITNYAKGSKHPYHLVGADNNCTVYGWVDEKYITVYNAKSIGAGSKVKIKSGAKYGGLSISRGKTVPTSKIGKTYTVSKIATHKNVKEALIKELNSWVAVSYLTLV